MHFSSNHEIGTYEFEIIHTIKRWFATKYNFISKSFGGPLHNSVARTQCILYINAGKGTRHFNPLEDYRFFHHWFSGVKTP